MKRFTYMAFAFLALLAGCIRTEGKIEISGKVIDEGTKEPVPGRVVIVQGLVADTARLIPVDAGQFTTDSSGSFSYTIRKVKDAFHYNFCLVGDSDYAYTVKRLPIIPLQRSSKELEFSLNKLANLTIMIFRESKTPLRDTLLLSWKSDGLDGRIMYPYKINNYGLGSTSELTWVGGNVKSTIRTRAFVDKLTTVRWVLFRNGNISEIIDTIICKRDVVNEVQLKY